jgi:poly-beta-1,6-N-acetyl-D-glucosamine synthase
MIIILYVILAISLLAPIYTYAIYPLILKVIPAKKYAQDADCRYSVTLIIAAYNEEKIIARKIENLTKLNYPTDKIEFLIGSDGSSDRTVEIAKSFKLKNMKVFDFPRGGKVNALNEMLKIASGDILVFSDANTMYDENAILHLVKHFADQRIGCVSGQLRYKIEQSAGYGAKSEGAYWKYENWVKKQESKIGRLSGANGAIYAVRRCIAHTFKHGIINDDFYMSTYILQLGYDVVMDADAVAYEDPNNDFQSQFKRHIRDGAGHYQALAVLWPMLLPRKGWFVHVSHRVIKWLVPFFLILAFISNAFLLTQSLFSTALFISQIGAYAALIVYYYKFIKTMRKSDKMIVKIIGMVFYFVSVNLALILGLVRLIKKQQRATWETQR